MEIVYTGEDKVLSSKSVFLAGPTPREESVSSWRGEVVSMFEDLGFDGQLYIPEFRNKHYYDEDTGINEMEWDQDALESCAVVMFWIPRGPDMLGLSTNVEFGYMLGKGNIVYGRPNDAIRCEFLDFLYKEKLGKDASCNIEDTVKEVIKFLEEV